VEARVMPVQPIDRTIGILTSGSAAGPELAAAIAGLTAAGATVRSAAQLRDAATLDALLLAPSDVALGRSASALLRQMLDLGKPIAALGGNGVLALAAAGGARGLAVAAAPALHARLAALGAQARMAAAVSDRGIVTGSGTAFVVALLQEFAAEFSSTAVRQRRPAVASPPVRVVATARGGGLIPGPDTARIAGHAAVHRP